MNARAVNKEPTDTAEERIVLHVERFGAAHGLTVRERQVVLALVSGDGELLSIARLLSMNVFTTRSHLRSVFKRCDVGGKTELLVKLYRSAADQTEPSLAALRVRGERALERIKARS